MTSNHLAASNHRGHARPPAHGVDLVDEVRVGHAIRLEDPQGLPERLADPAGGRWIGQVSTAQVSNTCDVLLYFGG